MSAIRRQLNSLKSLFDGRTAPLSENLTHGNKEHAAVLRAESSTDVIEGAEKEIPEISNGSQLASKQVSKSAENFVTADFVVAEASGHNLMSKSVEVVASGAAVEPRIGASVNTTLSGTSQRVSALNSDADAEDFFGNSWSTLAATMKTPEQNLQAETQPVEVAELDFSFAAQSDRLQNDAALHRRAVRPQGRRAKTQYLPYMNINAALANEDPATKSGLVEVSTTTSSVEQKVFDSKESASKLVDMQKPVLSAMPARRWNKNSDSQENIEPKSQKLTGSLQCASREELREQPEKQPGSAIAVVKPPLVAHKPPVHKPEASSSDKLKSPHSSCDSSDELEISEKKVPLKKISSAEVGTKAVESTGAEGNLPESVGKAPVTDVKKGFREHALFSSLAPKLDGKAEVKRPGELVTTKAKLDAGLEETGKRNEEPMKDREAHKGIKSEASKVPIEGKRPNADESKTQPVDNTKIKGLANPKNEITSLKDPAREAVIDATEMKTAEGLKKKTSTGVLIKKSNAEQNAVEKHMSVSETGTASKPAQKNVAENGASKKALSGQGISINSETSSLSKTDGEVADNKKKKSSSTLATEPAIAEAVKTANKSEAKSSGVQLDEATNKEISRTSVRRVAKIPAAFLKDEEVKDGSNVTKKEARSQTLAKPQVAEEESPKFKQETKTGEKQRVESEVNEKLEAKGKDGKFLVNNSSEGKSSNSLSGADGKILGRGMNFFGLKSTNDKVSNGSITKKASDKKPSSSAATGVESISKTEAKVSGETPIIISLAHSTPKPFVRSAAKTEKLPLTIASKEQASSNSANESNDPFKKSLDDKAVNSAAKLGPVGKLKIECDISKEIESTNLQITTGGSDFADKKAEKVEEHPASDKVQKFDGVKASEEKPMGSTLFGGKLRQTGANTKFAHRSMMPLSQASESADLSADVLNSAATGTRLAALRFGDVKSPNAVSETTSSIGKDPVKAAVLESIAEPVGNHNIVPSTCTSGSSSASENASSAPIENTNSSEALHGVTKFAPSSVILRSNVTRDASASSLKHKSTVAATSLHAARSSPEQDVQPAGSASEKMTRPALGHVAARRTVYGNLVQPQQESVVAAVKPPTKVGVSEKSDPSSTKSQDVNSSMAKPSSKSAGAVFPMASDNLAGKTSAPKTNATQSSPPPDTSSDNAIVAKAVEKTTSSPVHTFVGSVSVAAKKVSSEAQLATPQEHSTVEKTQSATVQPAKKLNTVAGKAGSEPLWIEMARQRNRVWTEDNS